MGSEITRSKMKRVENRQRGLYNAACTKNKWVAKIRLGRKRIMEAFPEITRETATEIARFASQPSSGRAMRQGNWEGNIVKVVAAHIRHRMTDYDDLMRPGRGDEHKRIVRKQVRPKIEKVMRQWGWKPPEKPDPTNQSESEAG